METLYGFLMMMIIVVAGYAIFMIKYGKKKQAKPAKDANAFVIESVNKAEGKFQKSFNGTNPDEVKAQFGSPFTLFVSGFPYRIENADQAVKSHYKSVMIDGVEQAVYNQKTVPLSDHSAFVTYNWIRGDKSGITTHIWKHDQQKGWLLVHDHTSFNPSKS